MTEHTFFSSGHRIFSITAHMLGHKPSLDKFKTTEITPSRYSNHTGMKPEIRYKKKARRATNQVEITPHATGHWWVKE